MSKPKEKPLDRLYRWSVERSGEKSDVAFAKELKLSTPQVLSNWKRRGAIPTREHARLAKIYGRSVEALLGGAEDDAYLADLLSFWNFLLPESKHYVVQTAKIVRMTQNPVPDPEPTKSSS